MNRKTTVTLVAAGSLLAGELAHAIEATEDRRVFDSPHSHVDANVPEWIVVTNSLSASGGQVFEVYAIVSEGPMNNAVVSMKSLPGEKFYAFEDEARRRAG
jgi:hypothetical protein